MNDILKSASMVALMGEIFCDDQKDKNVWKKRMLDATGLLNFPDDWDELSENEKQKRLDDAIAVNR